MRGPLKIVSILGCAAWLLVGCSRKHEHDAAGEHAKAVATDEAAYEALTKIRESLSNRASHSATSGFDREAFTCLLRFAQENQGTNAGREAGLEACILLLHPGASGEERARGREYLLEEAARATRDWRTAVAPIVLVALDLRFSVAEDEESRLDEVRSALRTIDQNMGEIRQHCGRLDARAQRCLAGLPKKGDGNFALRVLCEKAVLLRRIGRYEEAASIYRSVVAEYPESVWAGHANRQLTSMRILGERP